MARSVEEVLDTFPGRRDDGVPIAPALLEEDLVYHVDAPGGDDVERSRLLAGVVAPLVVAGQPGHNVVDGEVDEVGDHVLVGLGIDVTDGDGQRQIVVAVSPSRGPGLTGEALTDDRHRRNTGGLGRHGSPHHGGRTATSTAHPRDDRIDPPVAKIVG